MVEITLNQNEARVQVYNEIPKHKWVPGKKKKLKKKQFPPLLHFSIQEHVKPQGVTLPTHNQRGCIAWWEKLGEHVDVLHYYLFLIDTLESIRHQ